MPPNRIDRVTGYIYKTSTPQQPLTETEIRSTLLAAQEMAPGEIDGLVQNIMDRLPVAIKSDDAEKDYWGVFAGLFVLFTWFISMPWWAWYLLHIHESTSMAVGAIIFSIWAASVLAAIVTLLRKISDEA